MRWQSKALAMGMASVLPRGSELYQWGQVRFGRLAAVPERRLGDAVKLADWIQDGTHPLTDCVLLEVGTGHVPLVPIYLWIMGAKEVWTVDLHRRLNLSVTRSALTAICEREEVIVAEMAEVCPPEEARKRIEMARQFADDPTELFDRARIRYRAPSDASATTFPDDSVDVVFSTTVMEHVPAGAMSDIFRESHRILRPDGKAVHFIDPSDHFHHQDNNISAINFLRYSPSMWRAIAGNEFAYCNRLRASQLKEIITSAGFVLDREEAIVDEESLLLLESGFRVANDFAELDNVDLATTRLDIMAHPRSEAPHI